MSVLTSKRAACACSSTRRAMPPTRLWSSGAMRPAEAMMAASSQRIMSCALPAIGARRPM
ncbi:MAG: hypothetical protein ABWY05_10920 [Noviherbaspirillum sp.]